jgi:hypothetical protein
MVQVSSSAPCSQTPSVYVPPLKSPLMLGELEGKRPLGRPRHRWMDNIKMYLIEI